MPASARRMRQRERGFTLLEMAIVLAIVGLLIGMAVPLLGQMMTSTRSKATRSHLETIEQALVIYVRNTGRLPCPGDPSASTLGDESNNCNSSKKADGIVPFRTLGLQQTVAEDGYGHYFTYHVATSFASSSLSTDITTGFCTQTSGLTVNDGNGTSVASTPIAYILVSPGENGYGRYSPPSNKRVDTSSEGNFEAENANDDTTFVDTTPIASGVTNGPFDDVVAWRTRDQIGDDVQQYGCP